MKYIKKPVVIEAVLWDCKPETLKNLRNDGMRVIQVATTAKGVCHSLKIETLEGGLFVDDGDWIIKGYSSKQGFHHWPVKPDYFAENYEPAEGGK